MRCERCGGRMITQNFNHQTGEMFKGWKCIMCGDIIDKLIWENRKRGLPVTEMPGDVGREIEIDWMGGD